MLPQWDWNIAAEALPHLWDGLKTTLLATAGGTIIALTLGVWLAVLRRSHVKLIAWPVAWMIEFIRSTPVLVQLFFVYFLLPDFGWNGPLLTGVLVLGLHYSCYTSEVYRSGIDAVPSGQWDAATALGFSRTQTWTRIVLPQAIPPVIPALGNYVVAMFKDTPMLFAITVRELLSEANNYNSRTGSYIEGYTLVGVIFLLLSLLAAAGIRFTERKLVVRQAVS